MMKKTKKENKVKPNPTIHQDQQEVPLEAEESTEPLEGQEGAASGDQVSNGKSRDPEEDGAAPAEMEGTDESGRPDEQLAALEEQNLRLRAEFANYKRRVEKEKEEFALYIKAELFKKFLPVLDDFKNMVEKTQESDSSQNVLEGAKLIYEKFRQVLERQGLQKIDALGAEFDPEVHEALMMKAIDDESQHNKVVEVFQDGFVLNGRLLQPSKVVVGKAGDN